MLNTTPALATTPSFGIRVDYATPTGTWSVAIGDVNGDGVNDIFVGSGPGTDGQVWVFDGKTDSLLFQFTAMSGYNNGLLVAAADFNRDGKAEIVVVPDSGGGPRVQIFDLEGKYINEWKYAGLTCALYLAKDGQMWLLTGTSGQILKLDANGKAIGAAGERGKGLGQFGEAHYMAIGVNGEIFVADTANSRLHVFVKKGDRVSAAR